MGGEKDLKDLAEGDYLRVISNLDDLSVTSFACGDLVVCWVWYTSTAIAWEGTCYPLEAGEDGFCTPEAASAKGHCLFM
jgi:hypothetical protein